MSAKISPDIKFFKTAVPFIVSGQKTLEPRPRSMAWIERLKNADEVNLTYGARFKPPTVIATAKIDKIEIRPFTSATRADLQKIGYGWERKPLKDFAREYAKWYEKDLQKGYPVAWIYYTIKELKL